jgi:hypothetical protein
MKWIDGVGAGIHEGAPCRWHGEIAAMSQKVRDYRKFMVDDAIDPALLPLDVWNTLFDAYQNKPGNFYKGFKRLGVLRYDVEQEIKKAEEQGKWLTEDEAARDVLYEVIDELGNDMWYQRAMSLIEEDCRKDVAWRPKNYARYLDPVYDEQEERGWQPYWEPARWILPGSQVT